MKLSQFAECPGCAARADEVDYLRALCKELLESREPKEQPFPEDIDFESLDIGKGWAAQKRRLRDKLVQDYKESIDEAKRTQASRES